MKNNILHLLIFTYLILGVNQSWGQSTNLVSWNFTTNVTNANYATSTTNQNGARTTALANVTLSTISINGSGSGVNASTFHRTTGWPTSSSTSDYLQFSITLTAGENFANQVCSVAVGAQVSNTSNAPRDYTVTYGYGLSPTFATATNGAVTGTGTSTTNTTNIAIPAPGNITTTVLTVRILVHGSNSSTGNFRIATIGLTGYTPLSSSPAINASAATLPTFITSAISSPSTEQSFSVSGSNLTNNITITPPTGYQVSTTSGSGFGSSVVLTQSGGTVASTTIYARFDPTALANQAGGDITCTSTGASTQNVAVTGEVTNLSVGAIAFIAFQGALTDLYKIVALQDIPANTRIWFTDKAWDGNGGTLAFTSGEGNNVWTNTTGSDITAGTVIQFDAAGAATVGTGGLNSGLGSAGEQLFAYQGILTNPTFVAGYTSGTVISSGVPTASGNNTWIPAALTNGTNFVALGNTTFGSSYVTASTHNRTLSDQRTHIHTVGSLTTGGTTTTTNGSWPTYTFNFLPDEPTTQPGFSAATSVGNNQMTLNFSGGNGTSYMVVMCQGSAVSTAPTDATSYSAVSGSVNFTTASELSAGQRIVYNDATSTGNVTVTNLSPGTAYHFAIYAYNGSGILTNFLTTSPGTGNQTTTGTSNSTASDIIIHSSFTEPSNIAYQTNQENTNLTDVNSVEVARFTLRDGGATTDGDANATTLNAITFTITNHDVLRKLALYNGATELGEVAVSSGSVSFSGLTLAAADNGAQDFSVRASFAGTVTDNTQFSFAVSSATADPAGSTFAAADAGAAASSTTGDRNRIEVTATLLAFVQNTNNVATNTNMTPSPTVSANDALSNRDLDYTTDMTATTTSTFGSATTTITPVSGLGTFSNLQFSAAATGRTIAVSSGALTATGNSSTFDVTSQIMPGDIAFLSYQTDAPDGFSIITFVEIPASQTFYFTDNAWTSASGPLSGTENTVTWTTPPSAIPAGTVITFSNPSGSTTNVTPSGNGTASSALSGLATSGDQILMFRGTNATTPSVFICGVSTTGWISTGSTNSNTSYLPSDLSLNNSAVTFSSEEDNSYYNETQSGSISTIKALVNNGLNWSRSATLPHTPPTWSFTINATTTTISGNTTIQNLAIGSGETFAIGANTLTVNGAVSGSGTFTGGSSSNLTITGTSGTINFDQTTPGITNVLKNLTLSGSGTTTLGNALNITGGATPGVITFGSGATATLATGGNLTLASDANGTAVVVGGDNANITGNVTVQRYLPWSGANHNGYRFVGHPLRSNPVLNTVTNLPSASNTVIGYNNASNSYAAVSDRTSTWPQAIGYGVWTNSAQTLVFNGELQLSDVSAVPMGTASNRWNYAANPFPSVMDWHGVTKTNIERTLYRWDKNTDTLSAGSSQAKGKWGTYNDSTGVSANEGSRYMAPMQGFMVQASSGASSASLAYPSSARVDQSATYVRQQQTAEVARASVTHTASGFGLETVLCFLPQATTAYDPDLEARYLSDGVSASQDLYTQDAQGQTYSIQSLPELSFQNTTRIPLHLAHTQAGAAYTWNMDLSGLSSGHTSWLEDTRLGTLTPVVSGQPLTFTAQAGDAVDRFHWVFAAQGTAVQALESAEKVTAHLSDGRLGLRGLRQGPATIQWMDLSGRLLSTQTLNDPDATYDSPANLLEGSYYLLRVQSPQGLYHVRLRR